MRVPPHGQNLRVDPDLGCAHCIMQYNEISLIVCRTSRMTSLRTKSIHIVPREKYAASLITYPILKTEFSSFERNWIFGAHILRFPCQYCCTKCEGGSTKINTAAAGARFGGQQLLFSLIFTSSTTKTDTGNQSTLNTSTGPLRIDSALRLRRRLAKSVGIRSKFGCTLDPHKQSNHTNQRTIDINQGINQNNRNKTIKYNQNEGEGHAMLNTRPNLKCQRSYSSEGLSLWLSICWRGGIFSQCRVG